MLKHTESAVVLVVVVVVVVVVVFAEGCVHEDVLEEQE